MVVFLGRSDELERFDIALDQTIEGECEGGGWPHVLLVHGLGGIGKSSLLGHFRARVKADPRLVAVSVDWETERDDSAGFGGDTGASLVIMMDVLQRHVMDAYPNDAKPAARAFDAYRAAVVSVGTLQEQITKALQQRAAAELGPATSDELKALAQTSVALGAVLTGQPYVLPAMAAGTAATQALLGNPGRVAKLLHRPKVLPEQYQLLVDPPRSLARLLGQGLAAMSQYHPLVLLLDTCEIVVHQMRWLREVMASSGGRVMWVLGARLETQSEAGEDSEVTAFIRQVPSDRLRLMALTRFDDGMVGEYLHTRLPGTGFTDDQVLRVASFTRGLPLAVSLVADLLAEGASLDAACAEVTGHGDRLHPASPGDVVAALARRFLIHTESAAPGTTTRQDLDRILALAICYNDPAADPGLLHKLWDTDEDLLDALHGLARRHDFVLSGSYRLHDDVRRALRADLLTPLRRERIKPAAHRAREHLTQQLDALRLTHPGLEQQTASEPYLQTLLELIWFTCWDQPDQGRADGITTAPILNITNPRQGWALYRMLQHFFPGEPALDLFDMRNLVNFHPESWARRRPGAGSVIDAALAVQSTATSGLLGGRSDFLAALDIYRIERLEDEPGEILTILRSHSGRQLSSTIRGRLAVKALYVYRGLTAEMSMSFMDLVNEGGFTSFLDENGLSYLSAEGLFQGLLRDSMRSTFDLAIARAQFLPSPHGQTNGRSIVELGAVGVFAGDLVGEDPVDGNAVELAVEVLVDGADPV